MFVIVAGRNTTNEELESMLESDNPAIFTSGVSDHTYTLTSSLYTNKNMQVSEIIIHSTII